MTAFDELFARGGARALLRLHGELVTYKPADGRPRQMTALVNRGPPANLEPFAQSVAPSITVKVLADRDDAEYGGIDADEVNRGNDKIRVAWRKGDEPDDRTLVEVLGTAAGLVKVELR